MDLLMAGVTGGTGKLALDRALDAGHQVVAVARRPEAVAARPGLRVIGGDVLQGGRWQSEVGDCRAVLSCLGSTDRRHPTTVYSQGTANLLAALDGGPERRLVCLSSAGLEIAPDTPWAQRMVTRLVIQPRFRHGYADMARMEEFVSAQDVRWTIVRPPMLTDAASTGEARAAVNRHLDKPRSISRAALADYAVRILEDPTTWKGTVEVSA
ncbi:MULTISPECIES: NAD(P)-dependent oxidoreductase [unclassified Rhodococcus (in: high G+C Gram-positive bacteria)]|uniref:NAD(P)-dependent oxidoreductase n=1 Tax=unclassified Rhodococcus (in: high G+C Gram-positive bacteria) TaxID=192944 RepID=UPI000BDA6734|nr:MULTISPECIES: NAD(P)H-binding protein [unclassified Rhodococcus (in: high G+C Gram-positive bacteria)]MBP1161922.1 putative NADH-flavin reductase [Rhodococcus sp. PvR099]PTR43368.1 putative NADH-flavin reductase [Rhodococcus sp. OK611]SNX91231.1 Putative NADH-flavin reductase [Rhodococcus sp. OK270]